MNIQCRHASVGTAVRKRNEATNASEETDQILSSHSSIELLEYQRDTLWSDNCINFLFEDIADNEDVTALNRKLQIQEWDRNGQALLSYEVWSRWIEDQWVDTNFLSVWYECSESSVCSFVCMHLWEFPSRRETSIYMYLVLQLISLHHWNHPWLNVPSINHLTKHIFIHLQMRSFIFVNNTWLFKFVSNKYSFSQLFMEMKWENIRQCALTIQCSYCIDNGDKLSA